VHATESMVPASYERRASIGFCSGFSLAPVLPLDREGPLETHDHAHILHAMDSERTGPSG